MASQPARQISRSATHVNDKTHVDSSFRSDFEHEVKCLRKWLREMESRLQPLSFRIDWTRSELEEKATEHMVSNKDIYKGIKALFSRQFETLYSIAIVKRLEERRAILS